MSGQWEVVGSKKNKQSKLPVLKSNNKQEVKKKNVANGVNIEEVLPKSQLESIYGNSKNIKENSKPKEKSKPQEVKKPAKKIEKPQEPPKPKPPKSIESALNSVNVEDFKVIFDKSKNTYPDAPIVWLKELVQFLNQKVPIELADPVFSNKPQGYPLNVVPLQIKAIIERSVKEAGKSNAQLFFDIALTSMATEMAKGVPSMGWKFFLQYIALNEPKLVAANLQKHIILRNSYQNRWNVGLSILWAVGQVGFSDFSSGLTVFKELMLPLLEMKSYSRFIVKYLLDLIIHHKDVSLSKEDYLLILDTVYSNKKNFPSDLRDDLSKELDNLRSSLFGKNNKEKFHGFVEVILKKIVTNSNKTYQDGLCNVLVEIFYRDTTTINNWNKIYSKNVAASAVLLEYINDNWKVLSSKVKNKPFIELLDDLKVVNEELLSKKKRDESLKDSITNIKKIQEKMVAKKSSDSRTFILLPIALIFFVTFGPGLCQYVKEVCWKKGETTDFCYYTNVVVNKSQEIWVNIDSNIENHFPQYKKTLNDVSEPYIKLTKDLGLVAYNVGVDIKDYAVEKYPVVIQSIDSYAPGLIEQTQKTAANVWSTTLVYYTRSVDYLQKEVFVGQLSPENIRRAVIDAINTTQQKTSEYFSWLYEKVQTSIK